MSDREMMELYAQLTQEGKRELVELIERLLEEQRNATGARR